MYAVTVPMHLHQQDIRSRYNFRCISSKHSLLGNLNLASSLIISHQIIIRYSTDSRKRILTFVASSSRYLETPFSPVLASVMRTTLGLHPEFLSSCTAPRVSTLSNHSGRSNNKKWFESLHFKRCLYRRSVPVYC